MRRVGTNWHFVEKVTWPALAVAPATFLDDIVGRLGGAGIQEAVAQRNTPPIFDWLVALIQLQGISDQIAFSYDEKHGGVCWTDLDAALRDVPPCSRLRCHRTFKDCRYSKGRNACAEQRHMPTCPLPSLPLRKGSLNQAAYSLFLFIRDVCAGDFVTWIDAQLAAADPAFDAPNRAAHMRRAVVEPLTNVFGTGPKLWSMILADLLLGGDPGRERWVVTGAGMIAVDTLVHNFMHRTGVLRRLRAEHHYGTRCYGPNGCANILDLLARQIDARQINPEFPAYFPRFLQYALWHFCAASGWGICNGRQIDDTRPCQNSFCPSFEDCARIPLRPPTAGRRM